MQGTEKAWTLDEIKEELEKQRVEPKKTQAISSEKAERLSAGRWCVVTVSPGSIPEAKVWDVDEAELMWLMLRSIEEACVFVVSVTPIRPEIQREVDRLSK